MNFRGQVIYWVFYRKGEYCDEFSWNKLAGWCCILHKEWKPRWFFGGKCQCIKLFVKFICILNEQVGWKDCSCDSEYTLGYIAIFYHENLQEVCIEWIFTVLNPSLSRSSRTKCRNIRYGRLQNSMFNDTEDSVTI